MAIMLTSETRRRYRPLPGQDPLDLRPGQAIAGERYPLVGEFVS